MHGYESVPCAAEDMQGSSEHLYSKLYIYLVGKKSVLGIFHFLFILAVLERLGRRCTESEKHGEIEKKNGHVHNPYPTGEFTL